MGLGGQKCWRLVTHQGSINLPSWAPAWNGALRLLICRLIFSPTHSILLENKRVSAGADPHCPTRISHLPFSSLAAELGDQFADLAPAVHLRVGELTAGGIRRPLPAYLDPASL